MNTVEIIEPAQAPHSKAAPNGPSSLLTITLIAVMTWLVLCGFIYIGRQQAELDGIVESTRTLQIARQALKETDTQVLDLILRPEQSSVMGYARAFTQLNALDAVQISNGKRGALPLDANLVSSLKAAWDEIVAAHTAGQQASARALYVEREVQLKMSTLVGTIARELQRRETIYASLQSDMGRATLVLLVLQILTGMVCIFAFVSASRRSTRDSKARDLAVDSAIASREQVSRLFRMTDMLQSASDHGDANAVLRATAAELIPGFGGALYIFNNSRDRLVLSTSWAREGRHPLPDTIGLQHCWALKRGKPHINHPDSDKLCCEHHDGPDHALEIPMIARGEILGLLQIYAYSDDAAARLEGVMNLGNALADAMSLALSNIALRDKLRSQALRDPLTGLYNRRYMEDALERVVRLAEREKTEVSVIMIDLDHFKRLNDQYGHAKGDAVLRDTAAAIINQLRETDIACRYGGEELIVVLPNCSLEAGAVKANRIRVAIEALSEPNGAQVTASFGVASAPLTSASSRDLLAHADAALYVAKQNGRNRVACAPVQTLQMDSPEQHRLELVAAE